MQVYTVYFTANTKRYLVGPETAREGGTLKYEGTRPVCLMVWDETGRPQPMHTSISLAWVGGTSEVWPDPAGMKVGHRLVFVEDPKAENFKPTYSGNVRTIVEIPTETAQLLLKAARFDDQLVRQTGSLT